MTERKPIETAPKEPDFEFLVWSDGSVWLVVNQRDFGMEPKHNGCGCCVSSVNKPTHWMPLPAAPEPPK